MSRNTLLAIGAFAALLTVVLLTREKEVNQGVPKLTLPALGEDVTGLTLTGAVSARLEKGLDGGWTVNGFTADQGQVKGLTDVLGDLHANDFVTEKTEKHAELEVDDAKGVRLAVTTGSGPSWAVVFGKAAKGGGTYLREAKSNAVFTTNSPVAYQVKKTVSQWRNKSIKTAAAAELTQVTVTRKSGAFTVALKDGSWQLEPPPPAGFRYDPGAAQRLVNQLAALQAQDFADQPDDGAEATLALTTTDGQGLQLALGARRPDGTTPLTVKGDPQTYLLAGWTADQLLKTQEDLRDTSLLAFEPDQVKRLALKWDGQAVALARDGQTWKVLEPKTPPAGFELDPQSVAQQLMRLRGVRAARVAPGVSDAAAGFGKPSLSLELQLDGAKAQTLKFGGELPTKELYVKGSVDALTYAIGNGERQMLMQGLDLFKKRPPPDLNQIRGLEQLPPDVRRQLEAQLRQRTN